jgi:hypothetical protein
MVFHLLGFTYLLVPSVTTMERSSDLTAALKAV